MHVIRKLCGAIIQTFEVCPKGLISWGAGECPVRGWRGKINESSTKRRGGMERDGDARKPARNVIFRQMCGRGREIIAPARSSWSSVRKCDRIINVADARGTRSLALARDDSDRRAKSGPSQPRRGRHVTSREKTRFLFRGIPSTKLSSPLPRHLLSGNFVCYIYSASYPRLRSAL